MFYIFENGKLIGSSNAPVSQEGTKVIEKDFTESELKSLELGATIDENNEIVITGELAKAIELEQIESRLKGAKERYNELKELAEMRSNAEEVEFQTLETAKTELLTRRKSLIDGK